MVQLGASYNDVTNLFTAMFAPVAYVQKNPDIPAGYTVVIDFGDVRYSQIAKDIREQGAIEGHNEMLQRICDTGLDVLLETERMLPLATCDRPIRIGAGVIPLIHDQSTNIVYQAMVVKNKRDKKEPEKVVQYGAPFSGKAKSFEDNLHPENIASLEFDEEFILRHSATQSLVRFELGGRNLPRTLHAVQKLTNTQFSTELHYADPRLGISTATMSAYQSSEVHIRAGNEIGSHGRYLVDYNPAHSSLDLLKVVSISLPSIDTFEIFDGESLPDGTPLQRDVIMVSDEQFHALHTDHNWNPSTWGEPFAPAGYRNGMFFKSLDGMRYKIDTLNQTALHKRLGYFATRNLDYATSHLEALKT